jgi:hypothetical protein
MFTKKILGVVATTLVGLATACTADPTNDGAASSVEDLKSDPRTYVCTPAGYCECHDDVGCAALKIACGENNHTWYCNDPPNNTDCCCILGWRTAPTTGFHPPLPVSGSRSVL